MGQSADASVTGQDANRAVHGEGLQVCAVIVTFNRLSILQHCLAAIWEQTDPPGMVLVVDNHSSDETSEYLASLAVANPSLTIIRTSENLGPAGGFAKGTSWAIQKGYDYLWLMDDDCFADRSYLDILLREVNTMDEAIVFPQTIEKSGRLSDYPGWWVVLIPCRLAKRAGVPKEGLFWWIEDTEYLQWRLPVIYGVQTIHAREAITRHTASRARHKPAWKYYYESRNTIYYRLYVQKQRYVRRCRRLIKFIGKAWLRIILIEDEKLKKSKYFLRGAWHGLKGHLGKTIDPASG
jgi:rhamnopyranosyl-N-acetylglucosaminyl-diphospho-decaprenol beta-1,3/1,4-galactofuranosyltransferase